MNKAVITTSCKALNLLTAASQENLFTICNFNLASCVVLQFARQCLQGNKKKITKIKISPNKQLDANCVLLQIRCFYPYFCPNE